MVPSMCSGDGQGCRMVKRAGVGRSEWERPDSSCLWVSCHMGERVP